MGNIKTYEFFDGEEKVRAVIFDEYYIDGEKYCKIAKVVDFNNMNSRVIDAKINGDKLEIIQNPSNKTRERIYRTAPISDELSEKIKEEQKANFRAIDEMCDEKLDLEKIFELIDRVNIVEKNDEINPEEKGFHYKKTNTIGICTQFLDSDEEKAKIIRLHEFIHLIQTLDTTSKNIWTYWDESQVQALAEETIYFLSSKEEKKCSYNSKKNNKEAVFFFDVQRDSTYLHPVTFLKQMEVALGRKHYRNNFLDRLGFFKDFADKYGAELLTYLYSRTHILEKCEFDDCDIQAQYIKETQDTLFKGVFDKDIEEMDSIQSAIDVLRKMIEMKKYRAKIYVFSDKESNFYTGFSELYNEYYRKIGRKLAYIGYTKSDIVKALDPYSYENIQIDEEERDDSILFEIDKYEKNTHEKLNPEKIGFKYIISNYEEFIYEFYQRETGEALEYGVNGPCLKSRREKIGIEDENSMQQLIKSGFKPILDTGKKFKDVDLTRYLEILEKQRAEEAKKQDSKKIGQDDDFGEK